LQGTPKFTQIGIFGLKILPSGKSWEEEKMAIDGHRNGGFLIAVRLTEREFSQKIIVATEYMYVGMFCALCQCCRPCLYIPFKFKDVLPHLQLGFLGSFGFESSLFVAPFPLFLLCIPK
jgi:hypothetical protein